MKKVVFYILIFLALFITLKADTIIVPEIERHIERNGVMVVYTYRFEDSLGIFHFGKGYCAGGIFEGNKVITAGHIVHARPKGHGNIMVQLWNQKTQKYDILIDGHAKILKFDIERDLLLLEIKEEVKWETFKIAESLTMGEDLIYFGLNSFQLPRIRYIRAMVDEARLNRLLITPMFWGDSGGPVCNSRGEIVGFITQIYEAFYRGQLYNPMLGGAVPLGEIKEFLK